MARQIPFVLVGVAAGAALTMLATQPLLLTTRAAAKSAAQADQFRVLDLFESAFEQVRDNYVEKPDEQKLIESAINGMVANLDNSFYLDAKEAGHMVTCTVTACPFADVGIRFRIEDGLPKVITALDDSPAAKAYLMAGDIITSINDEPLDSLTAFQVSAKLDGDMGSTVHLSVVHAGQDKTTDVPVVRDHITLRSVRAQPEGGDIGYIRIVQFNESTADQLKKAVDDIAAQIPPDKLKGYVVDLRNNPGGLLEGAVAAADGFLDQGEIVSINGRNGNELKRIRAKGSSLTSKPLVVLINAGSAATAEVVAGALQDNHRAKLVGTRTFGDGSVTTETPLGHGNGVLRLATEQYLTPSGRVIEGKGISPDIEVTQDLPDNLKPDSKAPAGAQPMLQSFVPSDPQADKALNRAYDLLRQKKGT
jgi:carboxyl-terminal processing protease